MSQMGTIGICSAYMNPVHSGHIEYLQKSKVMVDKLILIINNDHQAHLKKGWTFMDENERMIIAKELKSVDEVFLSIDQDPTVIESIKCIASKYPNPMYFLKGGDRSLDLGNIPEAPICEELGIIILDGMGDKIQSSTNLINEAQGK
jgi:cytidyltransferase-like protein